MTLQVHNIFYTHTDKFVTLNVNAYVYNDVNVNDDEWQWHCFEVQSNYSYSIRPNKIFNYSYSAK